ncbi:hypothetical protein ACBR40_12685 [Nonomuraea sp. AD125B]|uniref:hypothetical protein n=1 Tax=Nonomuraea sp. AD125B TaxID=3242897 RepID=UPI003527FDC5
MSTNEMEALAWARSVFGDVGLRIRAGVLSVLSTTHNRYAANQRALGLSSAEPYGLMWLGVPKALVEEFKGLPGVDTHRPRRGRYHLPVVNGVPLIPWRYAKDRITDLDQTPFGQPVSTTKKSLFELIHIQPSLFSGEDEAEEDVLADLTPEQLAELDAYGEEIYELAANQQLVAVLAYASNPEALLRCFFGYARLRTDDLLEWAFREEFAIAPQEGSKLVSTTQSRAAFDTGTPENPVLRPRSPLEGSPATEPPTPPRKTGDSE